MAALLAGMLEHDPGRRLSIDAVIKRHPEVMAESPDWTKAVGIVAAFAAAVGVLMAVFKGK